MRKSISHSDSSRHETFFRMNWTVRMHLSDIFCNDNFLWCGGGKKLSIHSRGRNPSCIVRLLHSVHRPTSNSTMDPRFKKWSYTLEDAVYSTFFSSRPPPGHYRISDSIKKFKPKNSLIIIKMNCPSCL